MRTTDGIPSCVPPNADLTAVASHRHHLKREVRFGEVLTTASERTGSHLPPGWTPALWNGDVDYAFLEYAAARHRLESMTGGPMPTLSAAIERGQLEPRQGERTSGHDTWNCTQQLMTCTYSVSHDYKDAARKEAATRICAFFQRWRALERAQTLRCVALRVWQCRTTPRRWNPPDRRCNRVLLPGAQGGCFLPPDIPAEFQSRFALSMAVGIESSLQFAKGADGDRATHTLPFCMPLCAQAILAMGTAATLKHLPPAVTAGRSSALAPSAMREIEGLIAGGFAQELGEDEAVWQASLFSVDKVKRTLPDPTGALDDVVGGMSKHFRADLVKCPLFCGAHGVPTGCWKAQRDLLAERIHRAAGSNGTDDDIRSRVKREMVRFEEWWLELHTSDADEVRVVFNQKGEVNDAYQTVGVTMMGPALALSMCSTGATLITKDERKGYYQVKTSRAHSLLLAMRLPGGGFAGWVRAPMGNRKSSDDFVQQVTFTKMILSCLSPWRAAHTRRNSPEMAGCSPSTRYDPNLPVGFVRTDSRGREVADFVTFADDWCFFYPPSGIADRGTRLGNMGTQATIEVGYTTGRHLHRTKGDGPSTMVPYTGFELHSEGGADSLPYLGIPEMKQANGCIRIFNLALQCGVDLLPLVNRFLPADLDVGAALAMTREGSELHLALRRKALAHAVRRDIAKVVGFFNHLAAVVPPLAACMRSISSCIYEGVASGSQMPSAVVDWDSTCAMSTRGWLDLARALWILKRESYHKIATKAGEYGTLAIQDAAEELGGGFVAELGSKGGASGRMRVFHGPHAPAEQHMTSGPKELCFIRNSIKEAIRLWKQKGHSTSRHGSEEERQGVLRFLDPNRALVLRVCRLLLFTDSTVSVHAARKGYSSSPEMAAIIEEIELLLMDAGLQLCIKHISGKTMIRLHVDGASRGDAGPLLRVQDARHLHPFLIHEWGLTERLKREVLKEHPGVIFLGEHDDIDWVGLAGHTFCFSPHPESLVPIAMRALDVWSTRPYSTTMIMLVARDFGTWGLRPIMRQFDQVKTGVRFRRIEAAGANCIWDTMWMTKGPLKRAPIGNKEIAQRHRELSAVRKAERLEKEARTPTRGPGDPIGADRAFELGLGEASGPERRVLPHAHFEPGPRHKLYDLNAPLNREERRLVAGADARLAHTIEENELILNEMAALGLRGERIRPTHVFQGYPAAQREWTSLRGRVLTGSRQARCRDEHGTCVCCGDRGILTELFACAFRETGAVTKEYGQLAACGEILCAVCLEHCVPVKAHPSREGRPAVILGRQHARMIAGAHVCAGCRWGITTGRALDPADGEDGYVRELISQMLLDMYRHLAPSTLNGYTREVNLMRDFHRAVPALNIKDILGSCAIDIDEMGASTTHAMLWLHQERTTGNSFGAIRKTRSVYAKLCEQHGRRSPLSAEGGEFQRFVKAFRMRVGSGSTPSPALPVGTWFEMIARHGLSYNEKLAAEDWLGARDELCKLVYVEIAFLGFLRPSEPLMLQREHVRTMMCPPRRAQRKGVEPFVCLPLLGPTKSLAYAAAGVVICWETQSKVAIGEHMEALLQTYERDGAPEGPLFTQGTEERAWTTHHALHRVLRPDLRAMQEEGRGGSEDVPVQLFTLNTFRRGGNSHARDRGAERWHCTAHGRWEGQYEERDSLAMSDLYDAAGTDRRLGITQRMC